MLKQKTSTSIVGRNAGKRKWKCSGVRTQRSTRSFDTCAGDVRRHGRRSKVALFAFLFIYLLLWGKEGSGMNSLTQRIANVAYLCRQPVVFFFGVADCFNFVQQRSTAAQYTTWLQQRRFTQVHFFSNKSKRIFYPSVWIKRIKLNLKKIKLKQKLISK